MENPLNYTNKILTHTKLFLVFISLILVSISGLPSITEGASPSLYLSPLSGTYLVGNTFSAAVKVNSGGEAINAAEGTLIFNPAEIQVVSLSKTDSIFTLWTTEPTFSNSIGNIVFGGGTPTNFTGTAGTLITITFKARASASAQIAFSSGSVLAADGKGTNILGSLQGGLYTLKSKIVTPPAEEVPPEEYVAPPTAGAPAAPAVSSASHPEPEKWYSNNAPEFSWKVPTDVTAVKLLLGPQPGATPIVLYSPPISEKKVENLEDGVWYFIIRFKNQYGWGGITSRKVLVDTEAPKPFEIKVDNGGEPTNPTPILYFNTIDSLSGVEYYEVKIGDKEPIPVTLGYLKENPYKMPPQAPGKHNIIVKAVDKAGNFTLASEDVKIEPIETPVITDFPRTVGVGDSLTIKGTSKYPDATLTVYVKKEGEEQITKDTKTDSEGNWLFIYDKSLDKGTYQVWAQITDKRGAKSNLTEKITLAATLPTLLRIGGVAIGYLTIMSTLAILIAVLIIVIFYTNYQISLWRKRIRKETKEVEENVIRAFKALREEVEEQIEYLDGKPGLNKEERRVRDKLKEALDISQEFIGKEIKDVEKEVE